MRTDHDLIIIGHGLAGGVLAATAVNRGMRVRVFDAPKAVRHRAWLQEL